eukprot:8451217-Ditylum_brightwellii.AAC.1
MNGALEGARGLIVLSDPQVHVPSSDRSVISDTSPSDANDSLNLYVMMMKWKNLSTNNIKKDW